MINLINYSEDKILEDNKKEIQEFFMQEFYDLLPHKLFYWLDKQKREWLVKFILKVYGIKAGRKLKYDRRNGLNDVEAIVYVVSKRPNRECLSAITFENKASSNDKDTVPMTLYEELDFLREENIKLKNELGYYHFKKLFKKW